MSADRLNELSVSDIARGVGEGAYTAEAVTRACLDRIAAREPELRAWAFFDPDLALEQARALDRAPHRGPLHGVPIGVKDIIDTVDMPTEMGSPIYAGNRPPGDASCVALVRAAGAVILGKTVTCEFAGMSPGVTRNPHNPDHTPGGSSSGSAAAVADFMTAAAFGTQTGGSVLRPSSYCGIIGFKPSFGTFNVGGVKAAAVSLDTIGLHARSLDDIELLTDVLVGRPRSPRSAPETPPTLGLCRTPMWEFAEPETVDAVEDAASRLAAAGATLRDVALPETFAGLTEARSEFNGRDIINRYERSRLMAYEWNSHRDRISEGLARVIQQGLDTDYQDYVAAQILADDCRARLDEVFDGIDVMLAPCADGEAPKGLEYTGNPRFQGLWTVLQAPSITLPTHRGPSGLPVGIQLVAPRRADDRLLSVARWVWQKLGPVEP
jgi:Asp-tRNA(Asn)/Glu-tRNA(Gln) amidotransferase A subunit family amidase